MTFVTLTVFRNRIEAEIARGKLKAHGIDSYVLADDAGGATPYPMAYSFGARLKVNEEDVEKAQDILIQMKTKSRKPLINKAVKILILAFILLVLVLRLYPIGIGTTGLRPTVHGCIGVKLWTGDVHTYLPNGRAEFAGFAYYVDDSKFKFWVDGYCLGKDVFYGE